MGSLTKFPKSVYWKIYPNWPNITYTNKIKIPIKFKWNDNETYT